MINEQIRDREVRLVDQDGTQLGIMATSTALEMAEERMLDLVNIAPTAKPPVCKIMDYGKHRFEQSKREKEARKNQKVITLKEVKLSVNIEEHDFNVRVKQTREFLEEGDKVKVSIRFYGRQQSHPEVAQQKMRAFAGLLTDLCNVERQPLIDGRHMIMILSPKVTA